MLRLHIARVDGPTLQIVGADLRHVRAQHVPLGETFVVFDDAGHEHTAVLERITLGSATLRIVASQVVSRESSCALVLAVALLKGPKMDLVVEKATELGVHTIRPITTRRIVATGDHCERWRRLAIAAAKQSGRTHVPAIAPIQPMAAVLDDPHAGLRLLVWEGERSRRLGAVVESAPLVTVIVGPEGGFADDEVQHAHARGAISVTLGPRILRAETAAITAVALCQHRFGDG